MTNVNLQISRAIIINKDASLQESTYVDVSQLNRVECHFGENPGKICLTCPNSEAALLHTVIETPQKRISETCVTFCHNPEENIVYVAEKKSQLIETMIDQVEAGKSTSR